MMTAKLSTLFTADRAALFAGLMFGIPAALFLLAPLTFGG